MPMFSCAHQLKAPTPCPHCNPKTFAKLSPAVQSQIRAVIDPVAEKAAEMVREAEAREAGPSAVADAEPKAIPPAGMRTVERTRGSRKRSASDGPIVHVQNPADPDE